jgi:hypothetical protein
MGLTARSAVEISTARLRRGIAARWREWGELAVQAPLFFAAMVSVFTTIGIVAVLLVEALPFFQQVSLKEFLLDTQWTPLFTPETFRDHAAGGGNVPHLGGGAGPGHAGGDAERDLP